MPKHSDQNFEARSNLGKMLYFSKAFNIKLADFIIPILLSFLIIFLEGINTAILIPLAKGLVTMKFKFNVRLPFVRKIMHIMFPPDNPFLLTLTVLIIILISINAAKAVIQYINGRVLRRRFAAFSYKIRNFLFARYLLFGKLFFDRCNQSYLTDLLMNFSNTIVNSFANLQGVIMSLLMLTVYMGFMIAISWEMTILVILIYMAQNYFSKLITKKIKRISLVIVAAKKGLSLKVFNLLSCVPLVKAYDKEEDEKRQFAALNKRVNDLQLDADKKIALLAPFNEVSMQTTLLILILASMYCAVTKRAGNVSIFLVFFYIAKKCSYQFNSLLGFKSSMASASGPMTHVARILNDERKFILKDGSKEFEGLREDIALRHLNFSYMANIEVLKDITCSIKKGEMTAIVGPTGAGKTTIISLIMRFYDCPPSAIFLDGIDIKEFNLKSIRAHMAFVSQDTLLFNDTIGNNIRYGVDKNVDDKVMADIIRRSQLHEFIAKLPKGLNTYVGDRGVKLSGGEKQRISIARALLKSSEILLLDEATSALDSKTEKLIQLAIEELVKGRTTIVIAHRLSTIKNAHKIIVLCDGRIVEEGPLDALLEKKGKFFEYWQEQKFI